MSNALSLRSDLSIIGRNDNGECSYLIKHPDSGRVYTLREEDHFICTNLDGRSSEQHICKSFEQRFSRELSSDQLAAFIRQLSTFDLLDGSDRLSKIGEIRDNEDQGREFNAIPLLHSLHNILGWTQHPLVRILFVLNFIIALLISFSHWREILFSFSNATESIQLIGMRNGPAVENGYRLFLILCLIPWMRELYKGIVCYHHGVKVETIRWERFMAVIPLFSLNLAAIAKPKFRKVRHHIITSGMKFELALWAMAVVLWELLPESSTVKIFVFSVVIGAGISFLLNANPLGKMDGSLAFSAFFNIANLRARAVRSGRWWLLSKNLAEPLTLQSARWFRFYGLVADLYIIGLNVFIFSLLGYLLVSWMGATGAVLFSLLLILRFGQSVGSNYMNTLFINIRAKNIKPSDWIKSVLLLIVVFTLLFFPYNKKVSGEFRVRPLDQREVRAQINSQIERLEVAQGQTVQRGQTIMTLSSRYVQRDYDLALATLVREEKRLNEMKSGPKAEEVATAEQQVTLAETSLIYSFDKFERVKKLTINGHSKDAAYEEARHRRDIDAEKIGLAKRQLALVIASATNEELEIQQAEIDRLRSKLTYLREDLDRTTVISPIDGRISTLYFDEQLGELVSIGSVVAKISDTSSVYLRIAVAEENINEITIGDRVTAKAWAYPDRVFEGSVERIAPIVVDKTEDARMRASVEQEQGVVRNLNAPQENVVPVLVKISNVDGKLKEGMSGYARISVGKSAFGLVFFDPIIRFTKVQLWAWLP